MGNIHKNFKQYNPNEKRKILVAFDDIVSDRHSNKKFNSIVT